MSIKDYLHTQVEFFNFDLSDEKQTGFVIGIEESDSNEESDDILIVKIEHGSFHGQVTRIFESEVCSSMYDEYDSSDEKMYSWDNGE